MSAGISRGIAFVKMHGCGNDFLCIEASEVPGVDLPELARRQCDRRRGVGADGLILLEEASGAAARMRLFNADGSSSDTCGNGLRCVGKYLFDRGRAGRRFAVATPAGSLEVGVTALDGDGRAGELCVELPVPALERPAIPMAGPPGPVLEELHFAAGEPVRITALSLGNPHCVVFLEDLSGPVERLAAALQRDPAFPEGVNVEVVSALGPGAFRQRTFERGCGETEACGSGAAATTVAAILTGRSRSPVRVELRGGALEVQWEGPGSRPRLRGPAVEVCAGTLVREASAALRATRG